MPRVNTSPRTLRAVWLVMFTQGGWWTSKELRVELLTRKDTTQQDCFPSLIISTLATAVKSKYLAVRKARPGTYGNRYAVLDTCNVPRSITVGEVLK